MTKSNLNERIITYYDQSKPDYDLALGLKKNLALHYGYWDSTVHSISGALARLNEVLARKVGVNSKSFVLDAGFKNVSYTDVSANVMPTSFLLYCWSILGLTFGRIL